MLISASINVQTENGIVMYFKIAHKIDILGRLFRCAHQAAWTMPTICDAGRCYFFFIAILQNKYTIDILWYMTIYTPSNSSYTPRLRLGVYIYIYIFVI